MAASSHPCRCVVGLDLGTSSCKAALIDEHGKPIASATQAYPTHCPQPGWSEQSPQDWLTAATQAMRELMSSPAAQNCQPQAIGLTCAAHIGVLLDEADRPLRPAILWNDLRSASQAQQLNQQAGDLILHQSGQVASPGWTLAHLRWMKEQEPAVHARIRSMLLSKDYLAWQMTGVKATDFATAVSAQLFDATTQSWSPELCELAGINTAMLPEVIPATGVVGLLQPELAAQMHLPAGMPVITGSLDSATELLAAGCTEPGQGMIRLATAGGLQRVTTGLMRHEKRITYPHLNQPWWYVQAGTSTCAAALAWARQQIAPSLNWRELEQLASQAPAGCEGLFFHPYLQGERSPYWNTKLTAGFSGLTMAHTTAHMIRAVLEGTACSIRDAMRVMDDLPASHEPLAVVGGGSRNALWVQILASILNQPVRPMPEVDSALGAGLLAWQGMGHNTSKIEVTKSDALVHPHPQWARVYEDHFANYCAIAHRMVLTTESKKLPLL
jgi:xylulokinase